mgnify:CR=1 FL=1
MSAATSSLVESQPSGSLGLASAPHYLPLLIEKLPKKNCKKFRTFFGTYLPPLCNTSKATPQPTQIVQATTYRPIKQSCSLCNSLSPETIRGGLPTNTGYMVSGGANLYELM